MIRLGPLIRAPQRHPAALLSPPPSSWRPCKLMHVYMCVCVCVCVCVLFPGHKGRLTQRLIGVVTPHSRKLKLWLLAFSCPPGQGFFFFVCVCVCVLHLHQDRQLVYCCFVYLGLFCMCVWRLRRSLCVHGNTHTHPHTQTSRRTCKNTEI